MEQIQVMRKTKRKSALSIFSQRTYRIYKCILESNEIMNILVTFYNIIIRKGIFPKRQLKVIDIILEIGKRPILGKLQNMQLIETDTQPLMKIFIGERNNSKIEIDK